MLKNNNPDLADFKDELIMHLLQELRTPITNMKTALTLLDSPQLKPPQRQKYVDLIKRECDRQNSLINGAIGLLDLEKLAEQEGRSPVQLSEAVPGVISTYQPLAEEKGLQLSHNIPTDLPLVLCQEIWIKQITINLLHNSIKYTLPGGQVFIQASVQGDYIQLEFRDSGVGISMSDLPKIFDRFYRGRALPSSNPTGSNVGVGLGLTVVQNILLRCGGSISVTSQTGTGSRFRVLLPTVESKVTTPPAT
jgi:two-component system, OmpR family, phosphate regulon sensor histidine kinase PhoR